MVDFRGGWGLVQERRGIWTTRMLQSIVIVQIELMTP